MTPSSRETLPDPIDLSHHLSRTTRARQASSIKQFYKYFFIPGIGQLAGGLPNPNYFPYDTLEASVALPDRWKPTPNKPVDPPASSRSTASPPSSHLVVPKTSASTDPLRKIDLKSALQYGTAQGYPPLYSFLRQFTLENLHPNVPYKGGPEIILTCGNTDGFAKSLLALNNEWSEGRDPVEEREGLLVEEFAYMNAVQAARPRGMNIVPVAIDDEGMLASGEGGLEDVLDNWDFGQGKRPHLMYTVTMGQNPTSGVLSVQRRKEIYKLCQKYDIIIVEDDPYWYLQYPSSNSHLPSSANPTEHTPSNPQKSSGYAFLDSLVPSYLSVDTEGRVIRLDTFSKTIAPGCRLGWITAQPALIERILRITETSTQQPSGFVQSMVAELIMGPQSASAHDSRRGAVRAADARGWATAGWVRWLEGLRGNYERRMNSMCRILDAGKFLPKSNAAVHSDLAGPDGAEPEDWAYVRKRPMFDFAWPRGGMFVWLRVDFIRHQLARQVPGPRLARALWILWTTKPFLVLASPGTIFAPTQQIRDERAWMFFRICFAAVDEEEIEPISHRLVDGARRFWEMSRVEDIDDILRDDDAGEGVEGSVLGSVLGEDVVRECAALTGFC